MTSSRQVLSGVIAVADVGDATQGVDPGHDPAGFPQRESRASYEGECLLARKRGVPKTACKAVMVTGKFAGKAHPAIHVVATVELEPGHPRGAPAVGYVQLSER